MKIRCLVLVCCLSCTFAFATPSTEMWNTGTTDIQSFGVVHVGVDNYFTLFRKAADGAGGFPTDAGFTLGVLPFEKFKIEVGVDLMEPTDFPLYFNAKAGVPEETLFKMSPGITVGAFNIGIEKDVTDYDIIYGAIGKTIPMLGRLFIGGYSGNEKVLGGTESSGFTVAYDRTFLQTKSAGGTEYSQLGIALDYTSGDNAYGAIGTGVAWYFNENVNILTGPVFFNNETINGKWKWSLQLDANIPVFCGK